MTPRTTYLSSIDTLAYLRLRYRELAGKYEPLLSCAESLKIKTILKQFVFR